MNNFKSILEIVLSEASEFLEFSSNELNFFKKTKFRGEKAVTRSKLIEYDDFDVDGGVGSLSIMKMKARKPGFKTAYQIIGSGTADNPEDFDDELDLGNITELSKNDEDVPLLKKMMKQADRDF